MKRPPTCRRLVGGLVAAFLLLAGPAVLGQSSCLNWYLSTGAFGGYEEGVEVRSPEPFFKPGEGAHRSDVGPLLQGGVLYPLHERWTLDVRVSLASGHLEHERVFFGPARPRLFQIEADVLALGLETHIRFSLRPDASCCRPWVSGGLRGMFFHPRNERQSVAGAELAELEFSDEFVADPVVGAGFDLPVGQRITLMVDSSVGLETGWRAAAGVRFGFLPRSTHPGQGRETPPDCDALCTQTLDACMASCAERPSPARERCEPMCRERARRCRERC